MSTTFSTNMSPKKQSSYEGAHRRDWGRQKEQTVTCPYCGLPASFRTGDVVWGNEFRDIMVYVCSQYPECDAYVGVHKGTKMPYGTMANGELRMWRKRAHAAFDPLWSEGVMKRSNAYHKLAVALKIDHKDVHIGMFNIFQCQKTIQIAKELLKLRSEKEGVNLE